MYKFTPEQKKAAKELIRQLYDKHYANPIKAVIQERHAQGSKRKSVVDMKIGKGLSQERKVSYTDVKTFVVGSDWQESSPGVLAARFVERNPDTTISKVRQYVRRIVWELKKKTTIST